MPVIECATFNPVVDVEVNDVFNRVCLHFHSYYPTPLKPKQQQQQQQQQKEIWPLVAHLGMTVHKVVGKQSSVMLF